MRCCRPHFLARGVLDESQMVDPTPWICHVRRMPLAARAVSGVVLHKSLHPFESSKANVHMAGFAGSHGDFSNTR